MPFYFYTLPIEITFRILDYLEPVDILLSMRNVCNRLNDITDIYRQYQVISSFI
jgi:hypothetical protein